MIPEDVEKWSYGPAETKADLWTRGKAALPVYDQAHEPDLPTYSATAPEINPAPAPVAPRLDSSASTFTADGRTTEQIIAEARAKKERGDYNLTWKQKLKKASEFTLLGTN